MATVPATKATTLKTVRSALGLVARAAAGWVKVARFDLWQGAGAASVLAGLYLTIGLGATLIIGGVAAIGVSALREGGRI